MSHVTEDTHEMIKSEASGWIQEKIVAQKPGQGGVQLSFFLRLHLHCDVFVCLAVWAGVLGDQSLLPLQPVSYHVTFPL